MFKRVAPVLFLILGPASSFLFSQSSLLYAEAQLVSGYSTAKNDWIFFSRHQSEAMQKPSLGLDYLKRFSTARGDFALLAFHGRLAINAEAERTLEPQVYNAYLKFKLPFADPWVGHNRPAFGLSSVFDTHAHLLPTLVMEGYGFDRDWGIGLNRDIARGSWAISLTTGSGMPLQLKGNYLLSGRMGVGVLSQSNFNFGLSWAYGQTLDTMGYEILSSRPRPLRLLGADFSYLWNNFDQRLEVVVGKKRGKDALALFWRSGFNFFSEERLKAEVQPVLLFQNGERRADFSFGLSFLASPDLTLRAMWAYDSRMKDHRVVFQLYYYKRINLG